MSRVSPFVRRLAPAACGLAVLASSVGCAATRAENGALAGSLLGAAAGAAIGEANDNPLAGAILGGVGGAVVGSAIGDDLDRTERAAVARASYEQEINAAAARAVTVGEVIELTAAGVDAEVIRTHVRQRGGCGPLDAGDLVILQQNGVDPRVVTALQTAAPPAAPARARDRVVVEHVPVPVYGGWRPDPFCGPIHDPFCGPYPVRRRYRRGPRPGVSLGFHFD